MIDQQWAQAFAEDWIASWNSHDMERILAHYTDDFEMSSPLSWTRLGCQRVNLRESPLSVNIGCQVCQ